MKTKMKAVMIGLLSASLTACGPAGEVDGNHMIEIRFGSYSTAQQKSRGLIETLLLPTAHASVSSLKMCFKRLRFKMAEDTNALEEAPETDGPEAEDNIDFDIGEVTVSSASTSLGQITLPEGEYRRVEFDLEDSCGNGYSMSLTNDQGTFTTNKRVTIKFSGVFTADADGVLNLGVQNIVTELDGFDGSGDLETVAENVSGVLSN